MLRKIIVLGYNHYHTINHRHLCVIFWRLLCVIFWRLLSFWACTCTGGRAKTTGDDQNEDSTQTVHNNDIPERKVKGDRMTVVPGGGVCAQVPIGREDPHVSSNKPCNHTECAKSGNVDLHLVNEWPLIFLFSIATASTTTIQHRYRTSNHQVNWNVFFQWTVIQVQSSCLSKSY